MLKAKQLAEWILDYPLFEQATLDEGTEYELEVINKCRDIIHDKSVYVIEASHSLNPNTQEIIDHQSRVIKVESWEDYIGKIFSNGYDYWKDELGSLNGFNKIRKTEMIKYDALHCSFFVGKNKDIITYAYLVRNE